MFGLGGEGGKQVEIRVDAKGVFTGSPHDLIWELGKRSVLVIWEHRDVKSRT